MFVVGHIRKMRFRFVFIFLIDPISGHQKVIKRGFPAMNYKFILDEKVLTDFVAWLPPLNKDEAFYIVAIARNKYVRDMKDMPPIKIPGDKQQMARFLCTKESLVNRLKELECEVGTYKTRGSNAGTPIPQEAISTYISVNPRSYTDGAKKALKLLADLVTQPYNGYRLDHEILTCVQQSCSRKIFFDMDFDGIDLADTLVEVEKHINMNAVHALKTRGGFHLLVKLADIAPEYKKSWYKELEKLPGVDIKGDNLVPVPGTCQGMFMPVFAK
jgi:hypothetical protein